MIEDLPENKEFINSDSDDNNSIENETKDVELKEKVRKRKKGIIYVSNIPKHMNVSLMREYLGQYGDIGRIYLQPALDKLNKKKKKYFNQFNEGWVKFNSKRKAKNVAEMLNNTQIGTRKKSKFYDCLWSIKYLPRFKWIHLNERLHYEQAVYKQRRLNEISQARKETTFFQNSLDKSKVINKVKGKNLKKETQMNKIKSLLEYTTFLQK